MSTSLLLLTALLVGLPSDDWEKKATRAVVAVKSSDNKATGFVWPDRHHVVTAYHCVAKDLSAEIRSETTGEVRTATVVRVLRSADLALLRFNDPVRINPLDLPPDSVTPVAGEPAICWGHPLGMKRLPRISLEVSHRADYLAGFASEDSRIARR